MGGKESGPWTAVKKKGKINDFGPTLVHNVMSLSIITTVRYVEREKWKERES